MAFDPSGLIAYVNGEYVDATQASVSIFDHGFLYGDGVFEGMRVFDGGLFRAYDHMARIARSARTIGLLDAGRRRRADRDHRRGRAAQRAAGRARAPDHHARLRRAGDRPAQLPRADA